MTLSRYTERVSERIYEQSEVIEVTKISNQDLRLQRTVEQSLDVSVEVDKTVLPKRVSERISEHSGFFDDVTKISARDQNLQRTAEQILMDSVHDRYLKATKKVDEHRDRNLQLSES